MAHQITVLLDSALSERMAGNWLAAIDMYNTVFERSVREHDHEHLVEAVLALGHSYRELGQVELAREYYELTLAISELVGDYGRSSRAINGVAILHQSHGEMEMAVQAYSAAHRLALLTNDELLIGNVDQNLGTLANIRGDLDAAARHYQSALRRFRRIPHLRGIAGVLNNLGMLYVDSRNLDAAAQCLEEALQVARGIGDVITETIVHTNRTELFVASGDYGRARSSCDEAFEMSSRLQDQRTKADALKFSGIIYRETGKPHLGEIHLRQALAIATKYNNPLTEAETRRELALVLRAQERNREALEALNLSHATFANLQAQHEQADVDRKVAQLQQDFLSVVRAWGESIEEKDLYTRGHCQRVADYACQLAEKVGHFANDLIWFRMGAFLHDVGKTEVPEEILNKPGRLTDEERRIMEMHTVAGDEMLSATEFPWDIRPMVRWHHERWDGGGYPDGLVGEEIPLSARILRIADVFDALTTSRSYREPLSAEDALKLMMDDHGSFDPELFSVFCERFHDFASCLNE